MNYLQRKCQRTILTLSVGLSFFSFLLSSCSSDPKPVAEEPKAIGVKAQPVWFVAPERFSAVNSKREVKAHPFFDLLSFQTKEKPEISYVLTTPVGSDHSYHLNLASGEVYRNRTFCDQQDIWESYDSKINKPNFSQGIIPRLIDQTGVPQKIWVFGNKDYLVWDKSSDSVQSQRARVVGGVLLQFCDEYPCRAQKGWLSQLVLIAVNPYDPNFKDIKSFKELKSKVDWDYTKAFAENGFGRTHNGPKPLPAYRMVGEIEGQVALDNAFRFGNQFKIEEINDLRKNCYYLYDYLWRSSEKVRKIMEKKRQDRIQDVAQYTRRAIDLMKIREFRRNTVINDEIRTQVDEDEASKEAKRRITDWSRFFFHFHDKYGERFKTCSKFVRPANQKVDRNRFWFFAYLQAWFYLEDLNFYYLCSRRTWVENTMLSNGELRFDPSAPRRCDSKQLDSSFEMAITVLSALRNSHQAHYRFIEFDNGIGGSHQELYSWVYSRGKKLGCDARELETSKPLFPADVSWEKFTRELRKTRYDIIR